VPSSERPSPVEPSAAAPPLAALAALALRLPLALLFYVLITPLALLLRALRIDVLGLRRDESAQSYWRRADAGDGAGRR
jgi:hypothetical protein